MNYTHHQILELIKCSKDPIYFIENYALIQHPIRGSVPFVLYPYQKKFIQCLDNDLPVIGALGRQMGKTTLMSAYYVWKMTFHHNQCLMTMSPRLIDCENVMSRVHYLYDHLPAWMQLRAVYRTKRELSLENGSSIHAAVARQHACRGLSLNHAWIDEAQYVKDLQELLECLIPCLRVGQKLTMTGTGKDAIQLANYVNPAIIFRAGWEQVPNRDQTWVNNMIQVLGKAAFERELCVEL